MKIIFYNWATNNGCGHEQPLRAKRSTIPRWVEEDEQGESTMKNCISRRSFLKAAGILGAAGALAACGGSSSTSTAASSTASSAAASAASTGASIKLWTYPIGGWGNDDTVQNLISSFNAKYPDVKVTVEYLDYTNGDDQVNTAIEGGSAPDLVMEGPERLVANWGAKGVMAPLNDLWTPRRTSTLLWSLPATTRRATTTSTPCA
jgi:ABC-type glycerol-3-phosphate transport system substrate-binding protein